MADIFLSYSAKDREPARRLADRLQAAGWSVWWDRRIPAGRTWRSVLAHELETMRCMVVLWSADSVQSDWVCEEASEGRQLGRLVPVALDHVRPPAGFRELQAADLVGWDGTADFAGLQQLLDDIARLIGVPVPQAAAVLPPPAGLAPAAAPVAAQRPPPTPTPVLGPASAPVLSALSAPPTLSTPPASPTPTPTPTPPTQRWRWLLAAAVLLVLVSTGAWWQTAGSRSSAGPRTAAPPAGPQTSPVLATGPHTAPATAAVPSPAPGPAPSPAPSPTASPVRPSAAASAQQHTVRTPDRPVISSPAARATHRAATNPRCSALLERAALGEALSADAQAFLRQECRP